MKPDENLRRAIAEQLGGLEIETTFATTAGEVVDLLVDHSFDCLVLDPTSPDHSGFELLHRLQKKSNGSRLPVVVYCDKTLTPQVQAELSLLQGELTLKVAHNPDELLAATTLFLHLPAAQFPEAQRTALKRLQSGNGALAGKKVLIVDDDPRNILALTAVLEQHQLRVSLAEDGRKALEVLQTTPDIAFVLMDIMMPGMDGYETTRRIRSLPQFKNLPIIALTAKAMKGDREKCIEAGCSDYIAKPVDNDELASMLRTWLVH